MSLSLGAHQECWAYAGYRGARPGTRTVAVYRRLAEAVAETVHGVSFKEHRPLYALEEALELLTGDRALSELSDRADVDPTTRDRRVSALEVAYGLGEFRAKHFHRPGRVLILLAAESQFTPLVEGLISAIEWRPATTRLDIRGSFHLISRWWSQSEPRVLSRLAISSLWTLKSEPRAWTPFTHMYASVLRWHRAEDLVDDDAEALSRATVKVLYNAYLTQASKREIMQDLFAEAESIGILERRASFDIAPDLRRRHELTRLALDLELDRAVDQPTDNLLRLIAGGNR